MKIKSLELDTLTDSYSLEKIPQNDKICNVNRLHLIRQYKTIYEINMLYIAD